MQRSVFGGEAELAKTTAPARWIPVCGVAVREEAVAGVGTTPLGCRHNTVRVLTRRGYGADTMRLVSWDVQLLGSCRWLMRVTRPGCQRGSGLQPSPGI
eukprot:363045-Chlamydomonas_euryale.AAC.1